MKGENRPLVKDELVEFNKNRLHFKTRGKLPILLDESMEYTPN